MVSEKTAADRRRKIKLSAYILFQEKGVDGVTFGNIAAHSGISESSIYHYFPQKSDLMLELHKYLWLEIAEELKLRTIELSVFRDACGYQQIGWLIDSFEQIHIKHPGYLKFALDCKLYWIRKKIMINREEHESIISPVMQQFTDALRKGVEDKSIILNDDFDSCCFLLWGVLRSYIDQMVASDALYSERSSFSQHFQFFKMSLLRAIHP